MSLNWAIIGTGAISDSFVSGLRGIGHVPMLVVSRDRARAVAFADRHAIAHAADSLVPDQLRELADIAYVATPTALHAEHALACLAAGLHILVEKPFAANAVEAETVLADATARARFAMEGLWTRFLPAALALADARAQTGAPLLLHGGFAIANAPAPARPIFRADLAGGALRHYGIYPLALGQMLAGPAQAVLARGTRTKGGVDASIVLTIQYATGALGQYFASLEVTADQQFQMLGPGGRASLTGPLYRPTGVRMARSSARVARADAPGGFKARLRASRAGEWLVQQVQHRAGPAGKVRAHPFPGNGYGLEAAEAARCIAAGLLESPLMPLADTCELARIVDQAVAQLEPSA
jgi:predicted dehydrogenase